MFNEIPEINKADGQSWEKAFTGPLDEPSKEKLQGRKLKFITPIILGFTCVALGTAIFIAARTCSAVFAKQLGEAASLTLLIGGMSAGVAIIGLAAKKFDCRKGIQRKFVFDSLNKNTPIYFAQQAGFKELYNILQSSIKGKISLEELADSENVKFEIIKKRLEDFVVKTIKDLTKITKNDLIKLKKTADLVNFRPSIWAKTETDLGKQCQHFIQLYKQRVLGITAA